MIEQLLALLAIPAIATAGYLLGRFHEKREMDEILADYSEIVEQHGKELAYADIERR